MHSPLDYFPSTEAAVSSKPSPNTLSLNGQWKFTLAANPTVSTRVHARMYASVLICLQPLLSRARLHCNVSCGCVSC